MVPLKQGEQGSRGVKVLGVYGEYWGYAGVFWGSMGSTPTWNTYQLKVCTPLQMWVERWMEGGSPSRGGSGDGECCV